MFLKKLKIELREDQMIPFLGMYLETTVIQKDTCTQGLLQHYLQQPGLGSKLDVHQQMNE